MLIWCERIDFDGQAGRFHQAQNAITNVAAGARIPTGLFLWGNGELVRPVIGIEVPPTGTECAPMERPEQDPESRSIRKHCD